MHRSSHLKMTGRKNNLTKPSAVVLQWTTEKPEITRACSRTAPRCCAHLPVDVLGSCSFARAARLSREGRRVSQSVGDVADDRLDAGFCVHPLSSRQVTNVWLSVLVCECGSCVARSLESEAHHGLKFE